VDAASLARRLAALPAASMRVAVLRETLSELDEDTAARLCGELVRRSPHGDGGSAGAGAGAGDGAPFDVALLAFNALVDGGELGYERHGELYAAARARGDEQLARLLLSAQPPPPGQPKPVPLGPRELTLGERKAAARTRRRDLLDRLLHDPDPSVLTILLGNPRIVEADVVRLAARRPTSAGAQRVIYRSERFISLYAVKRALVLNPYTPSDVAARLVVLLARGDLVEVERDRSLGEQVRAQAREQLGAR
jgi:hypothetical protein